MQTSEIFTMANPYDSPWALTKRTWMNDSAFFSTSNETVSSVEQNTLTASL